MMKNHPKHEILSTFIWVILDGVMVKQANLHTACAPSK